MNVQIPNGPFFVPPYKLLNGGVDFLGLRQANLELMGACLPGINNVTRYIRAFSVLSWIHWKFYKLVSASGQKQASSQLLREFCERAEILFTWGHVLMAPARLPGSNARSPAERPEDTVPLTFTAWKRTPETRLMAPVQYGPASKVLGGLGFLEQLEGGFLRTCGEGVRLAEVLEQNLASRPGAHLLGLGAAVGTEEDARGLLPGWNVFEPTEEERAAFRRAFFDERTVGDHSAKGRRSATLALARWVLSWAKKPLTQDELRKAMVYARLPGLTPLAVPTQLVQARTRWAVMQVRQAQRLAHESLLVWLEQRLEAGARETDSLVSSALEALKTELSEEVRSLTVAELARRLVPTVSTLEELHERALTDDAACAFKSIERVEEALRQRRDTLVVQALQGLFLCARSAELLGADPEAESSMGSGGSERISLKYWRELVTRCEAMTTREFLLFLFEAMVLSQHFAVAANRFDGNTQRLRVTIEEDGLTLLAKDEWRPRLTADRLATALSLAVDCGLVGRNDEGYEAL
ncbi:hypothetical protein JRI60_35970 [Archangium violaceum]|uniref:hypothetical protein n=1 Tax=Archangium violaceum TaxID=83451 RepID=UPI00194FEBCE|nr:hypothetical protein [Archangium violaceum]QRN94491.1 hypothetical protein JRI60_35970 [Archangium violaceum]